MKHTCLVCFCYFHPVLLEIVIILLGELEGQRATFFINPRPPLSPLSLLCVCDRCRQGVSVLCCAACNCCHTAVLPVIF